MFMYSSKIETMKITNRYHHFKTNSHHTRHCTNHVDLLVRFSYLLIYTKATVKQFKFTKCIYIIYTR